MKLFTQGHEVACENKDRKNCGSPTSWFRARFFLVCLPLRVNTVMVMVSYSWPSVTVRNICSGSREELSECKTRVRADAHFLELGLEAEESVHTPARLGFMLSGL